MRKGARLRGRSAVYFTGGLDIQEAKVPPSGLTFASVFHSGACGHRSLMECWRPVARRPFPEPTEHGMVSHSTGGESVLPSPNANPNRTVEHDRADRQAPRPAALRFRGFRPVSRSRSGRSMPTSRSEPSPLQTPADPVVRPHPVGDPCPAIATSVKISRYICRRFIARRGFIKMPGRVLSIISRCSRQASRSRISR